MTLSWQIQEVWFGLGEAIYELTGCFYLIVYLYTGYY